MITLIACPHCYYDLRDHIEAVHESGHEVEKCPKCHFPLKLFVQASTELAKYGYTVEEQHKKAWR